MGLWEQLEILLNDVLSNFPDYERNRVLNQLQLFLSEGNQEGLHLVERLRTSDPLGEPERSRAYSLDQTVMYYRRKNPRCTTGDVLMKIASGELTLTERGDIYGGSIVDSLSGKKLTRVTGHPESEKKLDAEDLISRLQEATNLELKYVREQLDRGSEYLEKGSMEPTDYTQRAIDMLERGIWMTAREISSAGSSRGYQSVINHLKENATLKSRTCDTLPRNPWIGYITPENAEIVWLDPSSIKKIIDSKKLS